MPTLFMSYKRGTTAIAPLMERLRAAKYRLWFDRDDIHLGDPNWQARIDIGLERSQGVILGLTPASCQSEPVRYEVRKAQALGLLIFPVILERVADIPTALRDVGLPETWHVEDFTNVEHWEANCQKLLSDLQHQGLRVTRHDLRERRGEQAYVLHQRYLRKLVDRIGHLHLSQINPDQPDGVLLEQVYVDPPTPLSISIEVQDRKITSWTINSVIEQGESEYYKSEAHRLTELGYEVGPLESLVDKVQQRIETEYNERPKQTWIWQDGAHNNVLFLTAKNIAAACDRLVVLGAPGVGKSTFVKYLALCLAGSQLEAWDRAATLETLEQWPHGALTPVYVELRRFVASPHFPASPNTLPNADQLWAYIEAELLSNDLAAYADDLKQDLEQGHALLLLDGLDEVPYPEGQLIARQRQLQHLASSINDRYKTSRVIVASRPYAYDGWTLPDFAVVLLINFGEEQRRELATRLFYTAGLSEKDARAKVWQLNSQLEPIDPGLKNRPLFLTLMATLFLQGEEEGLPARKGALYRQSILLLLDRWTQGRPGAPVLTDLLGGATPYDLYERLAALAYDVHCQCGDSSGTPEIEEALLYKYFKPLGRHVAADIIPYLSENAGVLVSPGQDNDREIFHFAHRSFQEYLAASQLVKQCLNKDNFELVRQLIESYPQIWQEPCKLVGDVLTDTGQVGNLWNLLDDLLNDGLVTVGAAEEQCWWSVWLAGQLAVEQDLVQQERLRKGEKAVRESLVEWLVRLVETSGALARVERTACGRVLGLLGDPRPGVGLRSDGLPDFDWVEIPRGEFIYQDGVKLTLPTFHISRYPITYKQFQAFINAADGFTNSQWWDGLAAEKHKCEPREQWFKFPNHPRDNMSWYDAIAFCRWLSAKLGYEVTLPTEQQWEKAARGIDGREFPYGNEFDAKKANTKETDIGQTSVVGIFPNGASPYGLLDMSGNVFCWTLNRYDNQENTDLAGSEPRVVRGGGWTTYGHLARCAVRLMGPPIPRDGIDIGFRVCANSRPVK